jgi:DNA-binding NtrC family response regulator/tetratricopeptide (TPR) repeat protein
LLTNHQNSWLEGTAAIDSSCLAFSVSDLDATRVEARRAMRESARAGHAAIRRAAITNLGHVELARGRFALAEHFLDRAARLSPPAGMTQAGITDGLAQLSLARGDLAEAERILATARTWAPDSPKGSWYYGLWTSVTRARLLLRQHRPDDAIALLTEAVAGARELADPLLTSVIGLLLVEAQARAGRTAEATSELAQAAGEAWSTTIDLLAEFSRVVGSALSAGGSDDAGRWWFERGAQALASVGNHTALATLMDGYATAIATRAGRPAARHEPAAPLDSLPPRPRQVVYRLDACSPLVAAAGNAAAVSLERAASVVDSGAFPAVVGHEIMNALLETRSVSAAALAVARHGHKAAVLAWFGGSWSQARALIARPPRLIALGAWQDREYRIAVAIPAEVGRLVTLLALERLVAVGRFAHKARNEERERVALWPIEPSQDVEDVIFCSSEMTTLVASARKVAATSINVLVTGETGTGKEMIARVVHGASPRADRPFVPFNCTAVPKDLVDSQLFGHRRGSFTGAIADHPGVIRAAVGGTLYLDEIGELGLDVQPKLLRFLESGEIQPLGDARPQRVEVRIIASTNRNLEQLVAEGRFRADLFYRLNVVPLHVPPLRERREEVPPLAEHFLRRAARDFGKDRLHLAEETMEYLVLYRWPGNVRQLANEMRRLAAMAEPGAVLMPEHLDPAITAGRKTVAVERPALAPTEMVVRLDQPHAALIEHAERAQIRYALAMCGGRVEDAAQMLGLSRKGLYLKRQRLGLE